VVRPSAYESYDESPVWDEVLATEPPGLEPTGRSAERNNGANVIEAKNLVKDYGRNRAVKGVSFRVEKGDIVGLLGPNGSGKTTIMRMLTGFFAPTKGSCTIAGVDVRANPREARRHIGYLPERVALYPDMTVRSYLSFVARVHGISRGVRSRVDDTMERTGLTEMAGRHIGKLSKGFRQRVGIGQAVIHSPAVLILDEPTVGLDPRQIVDIRSLISELAGQCTVLLSTHILPEVSITCRRVLIIDQGRLVAENTAAGLTQRTVGHGELLVRLLGPEDDILSALRGIDGVISADLADRDPSGAGAYKLTTVGGTDLRSTVAKVCVNRGWALQELTQSTLSLEDLFVRILEESEGARS
jgi:ABC-2 type transport system ATP-binding protein